MVIIEDVSPEDKRIGAQLKIWSDRYPFRANYKLEPSKMIRPGKIIVTSNYKITDLSDDPRVYNPLYRRFKVVEFQ